MSQSIFFYCLGEGSTVRRAGSTVGPSSARRRCRQAFATVFVATGEGSVFFRRRGSAGVSRGKRMLLAVWLCRFLIGGSAAFPQLRRPVSFLETPAGEWFCVKTPAGGILFGRPSSNTCAPVCIRSRRRRL